MIPRSRETEFPTKEEGENKARASSSATPWLKSKDPRIVRVSRAFGGKDRHSKVCTIRGLRDRRVRLSVPTAIQLYDLQDRLGLNQPSKVVDWLLNVAKDEIEELPPLQIPQGSFINNHGINWEDFSNSCTPTRSKSKDADTNDEDEEDQEGIDTNNMNINSTTYGAQVSSSNNIFPRNNQSSLQGLFSTSTSTNAIPHGSYYQLDPSNFDFSQQTNHHHHHHHQEQQNSNDFPFQSTLSVPPSRSTHVLVYPQGATQAYFPSYTHSTAYEFDHSKQNNHFHMLSSSTSSSSQNPLSSSLTSPSFSLSQSTRPFQLSMTPMHIDVSNDDNTSQPK